MTARRLTENIFWNTEECEERKGEESGWGGETRRRRSRNKKRKDQVI
jgi:hypothetical protein